MIKNHNNSEIHSKINDLFLNHTPIEKYRIKGKTIFVKREDLFCSDKIAPLSKMRGVQRVMERLKKDRVNTVGVFDFKVSKAGVGISAMAKHLGMHCIECYQHYKSYDETGLPKQQQQCIEWGAELFPIKASRININYAIGKKYVTSFGGYMFPKGIILDETINATSAEVEYDQESIKSFKNIVISVGSGTIITGLVQGLLGLDVKMNVYGIACTNSVKHCKRFYKFCEEVPDGSLKKIDIRILPSDIEYYDECVDECPFPAHPNYDRKAWRWLVKNIKDIKGPTLFWNIGA